MDISIVIPSINPVKLERCLQTLPGSIENYSAEIIVVGPNAPEEHYLLDSSNYPTVKRIPVCWIYDEGSPARAFMRGAEVAQGRAIMCGTDDGVYHSGAIKKALDTLFANDTKTAIIAKYWEGPGAITGADDEYYDAWTHESLRLPGIQKHWKISPVPFYYTERFRELGGLSCKFEHMNMNSHILAFNHQIEGGTFEYSPVLMNCDSDNWSDAHSPLTRAYEENDLPLFQSYYNHEPYESPPNDVDWYWNHRGDLFVDTYGIDHAWYCAEEKWSRRCGS